MGTVEDVACCLFMSVSMAVFLATSYTTTAGGDAPELVVSAYQLGTAHPPGYPLWTMIGHVFSKLQLLLPSKSVAWCVGISSGFASSLAGALILKTVGLLTDGSWAVGLLAAGVFTFSPLTWEYSTQAEVFPLNNLLVAGLLYATARWNLLWIALRPRTDRVGQQRLLRATYSSALLCGLGMANQHTFLVFMLPIAAVTSLQAFRILFSRPSIPLTVGLSFAAGLLPYLYLPLAQVSLKPYSWGDATSLSGLFTHLSRAEYGTFQLHTSFESEPLSLRLALFASQFSQMTCHLGFPLACLGAWALSRRLPTAAVAFLSALALYMLGFMQLCNMPTADPLLRGVLLRFFLQPNLLLVVLAAVGLDAALKRLARPAPARALSLATACVVVLLLSALIAYRYPTQDRSSTHALDRFGRDLLQRLPAGSIVLVNGDLNVNVMHYLHLVEGVRPDLSVISLEHMTYVWWWPYHRFYPNVIFPNRRYFPPPVGFSMKNFLDANMHNHPIYHIGTPRKNDFTWNQSYHMYPFVTCKRWFPEPLSNAELVEHIKADANLPLLSSLTPLQYAPESWEFELHRKMFGDCRSATDRLINIASEAFPSFKHLPRAQRLAAFQLLNTTVSILEVLVQSALPQEDRLPAILNDLINGYSFLPFLLPTDQHLPIHLKAIAAIQTYLRTPSAPEERKHQLQERLEQMHRLVSQP